MPLFPFFYNTFLSVANDPKQKNFLPTLLTGIAGNNSQGKLLPIEESNWDLGAIGGDPGNLITSAFGGVWCQQIGCQTGYEAIGTPGDSNPKLKVGNGEPASLIVKGLENLLVLALREGDVTTTPAGYTVTSRLQFNYWDGKEGRPKVTPLGIQGKYALSQALCVAKQGSQVCDPGVGQSTVIVGFGGFDAMVTDAYVDADLQLMVDPLDDKKLKAVLTRLNFHGLGANPFPGLTLVSLTVDNDIDPLYKMIYETQAQTALESQDGQAGIFTQMNATLNSAYNLAALSGTLSDQLNSLLDSLFGTMGEEMPASLASDAPNAVDQYIFNRVRLALNASTPGNNQWYLPKVLCNLSSPSLSPLAIDRIDLPNQTVLGLLFTNIFLANVKVSGLTNVLAPAPTITFDAEGMDAIANLGVLNPPPPIDCSQGAIPMPPLTITADFSAESDGVVLPAAATVTVQNASLLISADASGSEATSMVVDMTRLQISIANLADLSIQLKIQSVFQQMLNELVNRNDIKQRIVDALNDAIRSNLAAISANITTYARAIILDRIQNSL